MKVLLIFPPQAQPFLPHPATPLLKAVLKKEGHEVVQKDLNLESYEDFLSKENLVKYGISPFVAAQIEDVKKNLRSGYDYFLPSAYYSAVAEIQNYLGIISNGFNLTHWSLKDFSVPPYWEDSSEDILKAAADPAKNPFVKYFEKKAGDYLKEAPDVVGISVAWQSQLIPALTMARAIKKYAPEVHICMGGSLITHLAELIEKNSDLFEFVDSFLPYDGEISLPRLLKGLDEGRLDNVPGIMTRSDGEITINPPEIPVSLEELPFADFDELPVNKYYSPQVYLPVAASRGCYWSKCAFCTHHLSAGGFRPRSAESVYKEMLHLHEKYGCKNFYFVDDSLPPKVIERVALLTEEGGMPFRWAGELRMEKNLDKDYFLRLYRGGCRLLLFGLESYCERILNRINKGIDRDRAGEILKDASEAGIITWVFFFLGFPGERRFEAKKTFRFIIENRRFIDMVAGGKFTLTRNSPVHKNPGDYGVKSIRQNPSKDLQLNYPYEAVEGMDDGEIKKLLRMFKNKDEVQKYLHSFVAEPHLLFFRKSYFQK